MTTEETRHQSFLLPDDGTFPNHAVLPLIVMPGVFPADPGADPARIERTFRDNGWQNAWRNGLYDFHHYHSSAHEVLGVYSGRVRARFGGPAGRTVTARAGDVIVVPAGVAHSNERQSADFRVVGAYPRGQMWDMMTGKPGERPGADQRIGKLPRPTACPVFGPTGPLMRLWH